MDDFNDNTLSWEQRRLGEIATIIKRNDPNSNAPVMMITAESGFIHQSERYAFNNSGQSLIKYTLLKRNELAYNHGASKIRNFGSCFALNEKEARIPFIYHCFSVNDQVPGFISKLLNDTNTEKQLRKLISSSARMDGLLNISFDTYCTLLLSIPQINEQRYIENFFRRLDDLLTLHQRKGPDNRKFYKVLRVSTQRGKGVYAIRPYGLCFLRKRQGVDTIRTIFRLVTVG